MKGTVIIYDEATHSGKISGHDGKRYNFTRQDWTDVRPPKKGIEVDFESDGDLAKDIVVLKASTGYGANHELNIGHLPQYWQDEMTKIHESNESYKGKWNWPAFFFGILWALSKGLVLSALICVITVFITFGFAGIFWVFYYPIRGNYMYYKKIANNENPII
jgi:hypothetical protein